MSENDQDHCTDRDRPARIAALKQRAMELSGGTMFTEEFETMDEEIEEQFWQQVVWYEGAPLITHIQQLERAGVALLPPNELTDTELPTQLDRIFQALAAQNIYFSTTNHLSDRELYLELWRGVLRNEVKDIPPETGWTCFLDLADTGSEHGLYLYLKHYADDRFRQDWLKSYPDYEVPAHEDPPYDRDRTLPHPD
jgi:hypothetical protein